MAAGVTLRILGECVIEVDLVPYTATGWLGVPHEEGSDAIGAERVEATEGRVMGGSKVFGQYEPTKVTPACVETSLVPSWTSLRITQGPTRITHPAKSATASRNFGFQPPALKNRTGAPTSTRRRIASLRIKTAMPIAAPSAAKRHPVD